MKMISEALWPYLMTVALAPMTLANMALGQG